MDRALSITSGNIKVDTETSANLRKSSKIIGSSNESIFRVLNEKENYKKAKEKYKQILSEHASIFPVESENVFDELKRGDFIENVNESTGERTTGVYQFNGEILEAVREYYISEEFELITQFRNPLYFFDYYIKEDHLFLNGGNGAYSYGYYFGIQTDKVKLQNITNDDIKMAKKFGNNSKFDKKIEYNGLVYFFNPGRTYIKNGKEYYDVDAVSGELILAYVLPSGSSFGSINSDIIYLRSL